MHGLLEQRWLATASHGAALWGRCAQHSPHPRRPRPRLRARAKDRSMDRKLLSLRCDPEQSSTLLWPPVTCNHSCIWQELACYSGQAVASQILRYLLELYKLSTCSNKTALRGIALECVFLGYAVPDLAAGHPKAAVYRWECRLLAQACLPLFYCAHSIKMHEG